MQARLGCSDGQVECGRDFSETQFAQIKERQDFALDEWHAVQCGVHGHALFFGGQVARVGRLCTHVHTGHFAIGVPRAEPIHQCSMGDAEDPGAQAFGLPQSRKGTHHPHPDVLHHIRGGFVIAGQPPGVAIQRRVKSRDELVERINFAKLAADGCCKFENLSTSTDITYGSIIASAGISSKLPKGLIIGTVEEVADETTNISTYAIVKPGTDIANITDCLVLTGFTPAKGGK